MTDTHVTVPTQLVQAGGIRFGYRRFGQDAGVPLGMQHFCGGMDHWILQAAANLPQQGGSSCLTMLELHVPAVERLLQPAVWSPSDEVRRITGDTIRVDGRSKP